MSPRDRKEFEVDEDKRAFTLKMAAIQLFQAWWDGVPTNTSVREAFIAGLDMALDAQVYYLIDDMPLIATNIVKDGAVLFVADEKVSKLIFTGE